MFNFSANHLFLLSRTEYRSCALLLMLDHDNPARLSPAGLHQTSLPPSRRSLLCGGQGQQRPDSLPGSRIDQAGHQAPAVFDGSFSRGRRGGVVLCFNSVTGSQTRHPRPRPAPASRRRSSHSCVMAAKPNTVHLKRLLRYSVLGAAEMARTIAALPAGSRLTDYISLGVIEKFFPLEKGHGVLERTGRASVRERDLPAHVVVYYVIALALYMRSSYREVLRCLLEGVHWLLAPSETVKVAGKSGISQARTRLGWEAVRRLHDEVVKPIAI